MKIPEEMMLGDLSNKLHAKSRVLEEKFYAEFYFGVMSQIKSKNLRDNVDNIYWAARSRLQNEN